MFSLLFAVLRWVRRLLVVAVAALVVYLLVTSVQVVIASRAPRAPDAVKPAGAIVVVGQVSSGRALTPDGVARCAQGAILYSAHRASVVFATGGRAARSDATEAALLATCMRGRGVPSRSIVELVPGTVQSQLHTVAARVHLTAGQRVIIVADPLDSKWLEAVAGFEHLTAVPSPAPPPKASFFGTVSQVWTQTISVAYGRAFGFGATTWVKG